MSLCVGALASAGCPSTSDPDNNQTSTTITAGGTMGDGSSTGTPDDDDDGIDPTAVDTAPADSTGEMNCGESDFVLEATPPNVMLVLDRSGSMTDQSWDGDGDPMTPDVTRWESLYNTVESVLTAFNTEINFGAAFFPSQSATDQLGVMGCTTNATPEVTVAAENGGNILAHPAMPVPSATLDLMGATPATSGIESALGHLQTLDPSVERFMILVTDGAANCSSDSDLTDCPGLGCELMENYDERLPVVVGDAFMFDEIPTFVVGIDIRDELVGVGPDGIEGTMDDDDGQVAANTYDRLNDVAIAGGRALPGDAKFFNAANEVELQMALDEIAGQVFSCVVPLDEEPLNPEFVTIEIGGELIDPVTDCATEDGWVYSNPNGPYDAIILCGAACDTLGAAGTLDATFGCPPPG